jgi:3-deoxy-manno-octulosonate cytidylyltransferase (CMP-KDO synthetase)
MNYIIIPVHEGSKRLPNKVFLNQTGKSLLQHTWESCKKSELAHDVIIATDSSKIQKLAESFGATVMITGNHNCGTNRAAEAVNYLIDPTYIVVAQVDYPEIDATYLDILFKDQKIAATLYYDSESLGDLLDVHKVKLVKDNRQFALWFSRCPPAFSTGFYSNNPNHLQCRSHIHIGVYAFNTETLLGASQIRETYEGFVESLEQLKWIQAGLGMTCYGCVKVEGIDTFKNYQAFVKRTT